MDILGVDIGGVIISRAEEGSDTSFFGDRPLETPAVEGALEALAALRARFGENIHLVSKAGHLTQAKTRAWLAHRRFVEITGIGEARWNFCRTREDKAPICAALGVTHFVDDRLDVLGFLSGVSRRYLFAPEGAQHPPDVTLVRSWTEIAADLL